MAEHAFFAPEARAGVAAAVRDVESRSGAEVVVAVRRTSGHYRHTDYLVGALAGFLTLLVLLFHPREFAIGLMPVYVAGAFAAGAVASANLWTARRALTARTLLAQNVARAARAVFVDAGIARTRGRTGVLVYVSVFERRVEVVTDTGVPLDALGDAWKSALAALATAARRADLDAFLAAVRALGEPLARALPRGADDENELPDEVLAP